MYYSEQRYQDNSLAIIAFGEENGQLMVYGDITANLSSYGFEPPDGYIFIPADRIPEEHLTQILEDIAGNTVMTIQFEQENFLMVELKEDWQKNVVMVKTVM